MTAYLVTLADGRVAEVAADEATTRADGSLWFLQAVEKPPAKLHTVLILARGQWRDVTPKGSTAVTFESPTTEVRVPVPTEPRFA